MRLRRVVEHVKAQNWTAVVLDFLIVVAGVFVGVQVNGWWLSRLDARKERAYLLELKQDFGQIIGELDHDTKDYEGIARAMVALLEESRRDKPTMSVAELNRNCSRLLYMVATPIVSDTYANLTGSGDLSLIRSRELPQRSGVFLHAYRNHPAGIEHARIAAREYVPTIHRAQSGLPRRLRPTPQACAPGGHQGCSASRIRRGSGSPSLTYGRIAQRDRDQMGHYDGSSGRANHDDGARAGGRHTPGPRTGEPST